MDMATDMATDMVMATEKNKPLTIAVDFDGTIVEHVYPKIGREIPFAIDTLKQLARDGHVLILWTARTGQLLDDAIEYCSKRGLYFYAHNSNRPKGSLFESRGGTSNKVIADIYIDDHNLGGLPSWDVIYEMISGIQIKRSKTTIWDRLFRPVKK